LKISSGKSLNILLNVHSYETLKQKMEKALADALEMAEKKA
jgi:hypothetical protein